MRADTFAKNRRRHQRFTWPAAVATAALTVVGLATPAQAACPTDVTTTNCQLGFVVYNASNQASINADGVYVKMKTEYMNVPFNDFTKGTQRPTNKIVTGLNVRGVQVIDQAVPSQFWQIGYTMGQGRNSSSGASGYAGEDNNRNQYKKVFVDGQFCNNDLNARCQYYTNFYQAISINEVHTYQLQRNYLQDVQDYGYRFWFDGRLITTRYQKMAARSGVVGLSERSAAIGGAGTGADVLLSMQQNSFSDYLYHVNGTASSNPPGTQGLQPVENGRWDRRGNITGTGCSVAPIPGADPRGPYNGFNVDGTNC